MTQLIELPGNKGRVFAIDPHSVTAVQPYEGELPGRVGKQPLTVVWVRDHNLFICAWPLEHTIDALNKARQTDADVFAAGFLAASSEHQDWSIARVESDDVAAAWKTYLEDRS